MSKRFLGLVALIFLASFSSPSFATVQNFDSTTSPLVDTDGAGGHRPIVEAGSIVSVADNFTARPANTTNGDSVSLMMTVPQSDATARDVEIVAEMPANRWFGVADGED